MAQDNAYHLTEGLWISAVAPDRVPLTPLPGGGGGSGFGGWGLSEGRPRGTGGPNRSLAREISARRVFLTKNGNSTINTTLLSTLPC